MYACRRSPPHLFLPACESVSLTDFGLCHDECAMMYTIPDDHMRILPSPPLPPPSLLPSLPLSLSLLLSLSLTGAESMEAMANRTKHRFSNRSLTKQQLSTKHLNTSTRHSFPNRSLTLAPPAAASPATAVGGGAGLGSAGSAGFDSQRGEGHSWGAFPPKRPSLQSAAEDPQVESDRERRTSGDGGGGGGAPQQPPPADAALTSVVK